MSETYDEILPVYIGYDEREKEAVEVCKHSIIRHSSVPLCVIEMDQRMLRYIGLYDRNFTEKEGVKYDDIDGKPFSTDFSFTRFLVPAMAQYKGWALFCDCDMLFRADLRELLDQRDDRYAAMVVKHDHTPEEGEKMDGQPQQKYHRKNWSSFILWNCEHPSNMALTPRAVNTETGSWLHAFGWLKDEEIGALDERWNWLEGWSSTDIDPANVHYTRGGPWFEDYRNVHYAEDWLREQKLVRNRDPHIQRKAALKYTHVPAEAAQ